MAEAAEPLEVALAAVLANGVGGGVGLGTLGELRQIKRGAPVRRHVSRGERPYSDSGRGAPRRTARVARSHRREAGSVRGGMRVVCEEGRQDRCLEGCGGLVCAPCR